MEKGVKHVNNLATDQNNLFAKDNTVSKVLVRISNNSEKYNISNHKSASGNERK